MYEYAIQRPNTSVIPVGNDFDVAEALTQPDDVLLFRRVVEWQEHDHGKRCCPVHHTHGMPHVGCVLR